MERTAGCASPQLLLHVSVGIYVYVAIYVIIYVAIYVDSYISMYMYSILLGRWKNGRPRARNQGNTMQHVTVGYQDGTRCRMCITAVIVLTSPMELVT
jgi:hypothetical protein